MRIQLGHDWSQILHVLPISKSRANLKYPLLCKSKQEKEPKIRKVCFIGFSEVTKDWKNLEFLHFNFYKTSNFREAKSINWNKCKTEIEISLNSRAERIVSTNPKITTKEFAEWKRKILQDVGNKIISLKHRIKVHKTKSMLKQHAVIEYLHGLQQYCHNL